MREETNDVGFSQEGNSSHWNSLCQLFGKQISEQIGLQKIKNLKLEMFILIFSSKAFLESRICL